MYSYRYETILDTIISSDKTGFIPGRCIGENTIIYYLMHFAEGRNIPGLLLMIDFGKALDSVLWQFIDKALIFFQF